MNRLLSLFAALSLGLALAPVRADAPAQASAEAAFAQGRFDDARKAYERLVKSDPRPVGPHLGLIQTLLRQDRWRDALREAQAAALAAPADADARGLLALAEFRAGQPDAAHSDSQKSLALDKEDYWGLVAAGRLADWNGDDGQCHDAFARAAAQHPERPDAWLGLWQASHEDRIGPAGAAIAARYLALSPQGYPFDRETPLIRNFSENEVGYWRDFIKDPPFRLETGTDGGKANTSAVFPIEREGHFVFVSVAINGRPFRLLFDTGASSLLLSRKAARRLALPDLAKAYVAGVQGKAPATLQRADTLTLGGVTVRSIPVTVTDSAGEGDGIFGGTILRDYAVTLDFDSNTMTITRGPSAGYAARPHTTASTLPLRLYGGHLFISAHAQEQAENAVDHPVWAILDTGAFTDIFSLNLTHELSAHDPRPDWQEGSISSRVGIGDSSRKINVCLTLAKVKITFDGSDHVTNQIGLTGESAMDDQVSPGTGFEVGMLLGIPLLAQHSRVTIDYPHRLLTFEDPE